MDIKDLLSLDTTSVKEPPKWPAGNYRLKISGYIIGSSTSKNNAGAQGVGFSCQAVSCFEADDLEQPELAARITAKLEEFGDWTAKEHSWNYKDKEDPNELHLLGFCPLNFLLVTAEGEPHPAAYRFYLRDPATGEESGFAHDVLGLTYSLEEYPDKIPYGDMFEACLERNFCGMFSWEPNQKPDMPPNLRLDNLSSV